MHIAIEVITQSYLNNMDNLSALQLSSVKINLNFSE